MSVLFPLIFAFFPSGFRIFILGFLALLAVVIVFRVVAMVLDAIPFL